MSSFYKKALLIAASFTLFTTAAFGILPLNTAHAAVNSFIQRSGDILYNDLDGDKVKDANESEFRFIGSNMMGAVVTSDNHQFELTDEQRWRLTDEFEKRDQVETAVQSGQQVVRTWAMRVTGNLTTYNSSVYTAYVGSSTVQFNETALRSLDKFLQICNEKGIRVIIPFIDGAGHWGGLSEYGANFLTIGSATNVKFKNMISQLLNRTNYYTGVKYKDDKAIVAWETGNELTNGYTTEAQYLALDNWVADLAAYIKGTGSYTTAIDTNHLLMDGRNQPESFYNRYTQLANPDIDILSYHTYYPLAGKTNTQTIQALRTYTSGSKVLNVGEISMDTSSSELNTMLGEVINGGTNSAMWWAFRGHNTDGGFYHHQKFQDLHWPGIPGAVAIHSDIQTEINLINVLANRGYEIQGLTRPALPVPAAPVLLPITDVGHIAWQGSTGAQSYQIQRATSVTGPWTTIVADFYENTIAARSLFSDVSALGGQNYYYKVQAKNASGISAASNVVGPVTVSKNWLVDEMFDYSKMYSHSANTTIVKTYAEEEGNQDDLARLERTTATKESIVYKASGDMDYLKMYSYGNNTNYTFYTSSDGVSYTPLTVTVTSYNSARKKYETSSLPAGTTYLKIQFEDTTTATLPAIGRVEIRYTSTPTSVIVDNSNALITYAGSWTHSTDASYYNSTKSVTPTANSTATLNFSGTEASIYARMLPTGGKFDVYIDGVFSQTVDTYSAVSQYQVKVYEVTGLSSGSTHEIQIKHAGQKNSLSADYFIGIDYLNYKY
ncbi:cellulase family glycosylhydrolase [Paenibacillus qinlingensis]|uniref:cellulase family glycosylhydrolase n=1 Tax=Paenibacillus qinlingensis TaxID=1837343 RepID=UPI001566812F|nr:cellulase family glycosylhydrolase [Paenibacillus qinlingensis]NQX62774.1 cellulase family glycosylhydrolase [Paenibacillus qinlingensis]